MNQLNIIGRIGNNAEIRHTQKGTALCQFSVAITSGWGDNEKTTWVRCTAFGDRYQKLAPYIVKGDRIGVVGELEAQEWDKQDGSKGFSVACIVRDITLLAPKRDQAPQQQAPAQSQAEPQPAGGDFDDIPFMPAAHRQVI